MDFFKRWCFNNKQTIEIYIDDDEVKNEMENLKIFQNKRLNEFDLCVICLDEMKYDDELLLVTCSHMFHKECLEPWIKKKSICPLCDYLI